MHACARARACVCAALLLWPPRAQGLATSGCTAREGAGPRTMQTLPSGGATAGVLGGLLPAGADAVATRRLPRCVHEPKASVQASLGRRQLSAWAAPYLRRQHGHHPSSAHPLSLRAARRLCQSSSNTSSSDTTPQSQAPACKGPAAVGAPSEYHDNVLALGMMQVLINKIDEATGWSTRARGYDVRSLGPVCASARAGANSASPPLRQGFVESAAHLLEGRSPEEASELARRVLRGLPLPRGAIHALATWAAGLPPTVYRTLLRMLVAPAPLTSGWLIGDAEAVQGAAPWQSKPGRSLCRADGRRRAGEIGGEVAYNVMQVKKCRYLEACQCSGMCVNLCKARR